MTSTIQFHQFLLNLKVKEENLEPKKRFKRDDDPPPNVKLNISRIMAPRNVFGYLDDLPFDLFNNVASYAISSTEIYARTIDRTEKLINLYNQQLKDLPSITAANRTALANAKPNDRRRQTYYLDLLAIVSSPKNTAMNHYSNIQKLRKLWKNKSFKLSNGPYPSKYQQKCCIHGDCLNIALFNSNYCYWHILEDQFQRMFERCPKCGLPNIIGTLCKNCNKLKALMNVYPLKIFPESKSQQQQQLPPPQPKIQPPPAPKPIKPIAKPLAKPPSDYLVKYPVDFAQLIYKINSGQSLTTSELEYFQAYIQNISKQQY